MPDPKNFITEFPRRYSPDFDGVISTLIQSWLTESRSESVRAEAIAKAGENLNWFNNGDFGWNAIPGEQRTIINRIRPAIMQRVGSLVGAEPTATFERRENDDPPTYFLDAKKIGAQTINSLLAGGIDPATQVPIPPIITSDNVGPIQDLSGQMIPQTPISVDQYHQLVAMGFKDAITCVDDDLVAKVQQTIYDAVIEASGARFIDMEMCQISQICGWQDTYDGWDFDKQIPTYLLLEQANLYTEPLRTDITRSQYAIYQELLSADEALTKYPQWAEQIGDNRINGLPSSMIPQQSTAETVVSWRRDMVRILHCWIRNQIIDMPEDEAIRGGHVVHHEILEEAQEHEEENYGLLSKIGGAIKGMFGGKEEAAENPNQDYTGVEDVHDVNEQVPKTRKAMFLGNDDGTPNMEAGEIEPGHENWPVKQGVLYCVLIEGASAFRVAEYRLTESDDIPITHMVSQPIPKSYFGHGFASQLTGGQQLINDCASTISEYGRKFRGSNVTISQSAAAALGSENIKNSFNVQGWVSVLKDADFKALGDNGAFKIQKPPDPPTFLLNVLNNAVQLTDREAAYSDVQQGIPTGDAKSGVAIQQLQAANSVSSMMDAMLVQRALTQRAKRIQFAITHYMTAEDWGRKYVQQYSPAVLNEVYRRAQSNDWDVSVIVQAGAGQAMEAKKNGYRMDMKAGIIDPLWTVQQLGYPSDAINPMLTSRNTLQNQSSMPPTSGGSGDTGQGTGSPTGQTAVQAQ